VDYSLSLFNRVYHMCEPYMPAHDRGCMAGLRIMASLHAVADPSANAAPQLQDLPARAAQLTPTRNKTHHKSRATHPKNHEQHALLRTEQKHRRS